MKHRLSLWLPVYILVFSTSEVLPFLCNRDPRNAEVYLVRNIVGHTLPKNRRDQFRIHFFSIQVFILGVEEHGAGTGAYGIGERLSNHCETENITIL